MQKLSVATKRVGVKFDRDKTAWSILPWAELEEVARVMQFGVRVYGFENWKRVKDGERRYQNAAMRHLIAAMRGEPLDSETKLPHLSHAIASLLFACWHGRRKA